MPPGSRAEASGANFCCFCYGNQVLLQSLPICPVGTLGRVRIKALNTGQHNTVLAIVWNRTET